MVIGWVREKPEKKKKENETEREGLEGEEEVEKNQRGRRHWERKDMKVPMETKLI